MLYIVTKFDNNSTTDINDGFVCKSESLEFDTSRYFDVEDLSGCLFTLP